MASFYAVAAGNFSAATTWAATSGGAAGAGVPGVGDDVYLDANTPGNVTVDTANRTIRSLDTTGFTHTLAFGSFALLVGGSTVRPDNVALKWDPATAVTQTSSASYGVKLVSTSAVQQTITMGAARPGVYLALQNASGGSYILTDTMNVSGLQINSALALDTNGQAVTAGNLSVTGAGATLRLRASALSVQGFSLVAGVTFDAGTSTITLQSGTFQAPGYTFNNVTVTGNGTLLGGATFANLSVVLGAAAQAVNIQPGFAWTVTGTLTLSGQDAPAFRSLVSSSTIGTPVTITAAAVSLSSMDLRDIAAAGAATPWTGTRLGDALGNSNITFDASRTLYAVSSVSASFTNAAWSLSSGGPTTGVKPPLPQDDVVLDAHSGSTTVSSTFTVDVVRPCRNFDTTNYVRNLTFSGAPWFFGSVTISDRIVAASTNANLVLAGRGNHTLYVKANTTFGNSMNVQAPGGTYTLLSNLLTTSVQMTVAGNGTFDANGHDVDAALGCNFQGAAALRMGSGTWTVGYNTSGTVWQCPTAAGATLDAGTSTLIIGPTSGASVVSAGMSNVTAFAYNIVQAQVGTASFTFSGQFTANVLRAGAPAGRNVAQTINFNANQTVTLTSGAGWQIAGSAGALVTLQSSSGSWNIVCPSGIVSGDYLSLKNSHASGGASFYAGANSTNVSNNTGWQFVAAPKTISRTFALAQAQNLNTQNAITRMAQQAQAAAVNAGQSTSRTFSATQGQGLSSQRAITAYVGAGQAVNVTLGALGTRRTFWAWQVQNATATGQPASVIRVQAPAAVASVNIVSNNKHVDRTWTVTQPQVVAVAALQRKRRTVTVTQPQALVALGRTVDSITFTLGQASVVVIGFGARFFACTQRQTPTVQREVRATLWVGQGQHVKVHLPTHRGHINVAGSVGKIGVVTTPDAGVAVTTRAGRLTVTEAV